MADKIASKKIKSGRDWGIIQKKDRKGENSWYARIVRIEPDGKKRQFTVKAESKTDARRKLEELNEKHKTGGGRIIEGEKMSFKALASDYQLRKLIPPTYQNDRKIDGLRSYRTTRNLLSNLLQYFSTTRLRDITPATIERFKQKRLATPVSTRSKSKNSVKERPRSIAGVNRELALLRAMLNDAVANGWLARSPFVGTKLISLSAETRRERVLTQFEEQKLLQACSEVVRHEYERKGKRITAKYKSSREHLRPLIITAIDTAMRLGELLTLRWSDVNLDTRTISLLAFNTKTARARKIGMTPRVHHELSRLWDLGSKEEGNLVFGIKDNIKRAFASACRAADIEDFKFHDFRHTAITRMIHAGVPAMEVMKISGHSSINTFARYVNPNIDSVVRVAETLHLYLEEHNPQFTSDRIN